MDAERKLYDLFICYSGSDNAISTALADWLRWQTEVYLVLGLG